VSARRGSYPAGRRTRWTEVDVDAAVNAWSGALGLYRNRKAADQALRVWCMERFRHPVFVEVLKAASARLVVILAEPPAPAPAKPRARRKASKEFVPAEEPSPEPEPAARKVRPGDAHLLRG
jgi:hypothetical protein